MNEIEILYISNQKDKLFTNLREEIHPLENERFFTENIHFRIKQIDIERLDMFDFQRHIRKNTYIVLHIDENLCNKHLKIKNYAFEVRRMLDIVNPAQVLIVYNETCQLITEYLTIEYNYKISYIDIAHASYMILNHIRNFVIHGSLNRDILKDTSKAEFLLKEKEKRIQELEKKSTNNAIQNEKANEEKRLLKDEANKLKEKITLLEEEKQKETDNIKEIITFLAAMPKEISEEQNYLKNRRKRFTLLGGLSFALGAISIIILIINVLITKLPTINGASSYLAYVFPVVFPMVISFLFYRQANMKIKEIEKINEKSILVQQVENALNSYNVLLSGDELKDKTISSIDRVINKIFDNNHKEEKSEKVEESKLTISDVQKLFKMGNDITKS